MKKNKKNIISKVPSDALCIGFEGPSASTAFVGDGENKKPQLNMVIYSGGIVKNHYWWDNLIIDLSGGVFNKKKYPILEGHDRSSKIAYMDGPPIIDKNLRVDPGKTFFVSTPESELFQKVSSEGFPYEASVRVQPLLIESIEKGAASEANGIKLKGPGTIFRKWEFIEGSVCVFGYDRNTNSKAFSNEEIDLDCEFIGETSSKRYHFIQNSNMEDTHSMDRETLLKEHPDLVKEIQDDAVSVAKKETENQFGEKFQEISSKVSQLTEIAKTQTETIGDLTTKNLSLEKINAVRAETELENQAKGVWDGKLNLSGLPSHMFEKVMKHVTHGTFVDIKSGECDWNKFSEAVDTEIKDWETRLSKSASSVLGSGYNTRTSEDGNTHESELEKEDDVAVDALFKLVSKEKEGDS